MLEQLNGFADNYSALISLLVALSTLLAVLIALWNSVLSIKVLTFQIKFQCQFATVTNTISSLKDYQCLIANIKNVGHRDTSIGYWNFFAIFPFSSSGFILTPLTDFRSQTEGLELKAGSMKNIELQSEDSFSKLLNESAPTFFPRWRVRRISISLTLPTGEKFKANISSELKKEIYLKTKKLPIFYQRKNR